MKVHQPQIRVRLIKTRSRDKVSGDLPAASARYQKPRIIDLTPYLSDGGVRTQKSVREPAGAFSISLTPRPYTDNGESLLETLDNLIEPMDMIEIRLAHESPDKMKAAMADRINWPPVVMRGFVSQVLRSESIANGTPQRSIVVSGQDYGKLLQIIQIFYLNNSVVGDNILGELKFFQKYADGSDAKNMSAADFIALLLKEVINPYLARITALADRNSGVPDEIDSRVSIDGAVSPFGIGGAQDMSVHQMLATFLDVGPFNELYIEDVGPDVVLVARPQPCWGGDGLAYDGVEVLPEAVDIGLGDVASVQLSRGDSGVYNIFEVEAARIVIVSQEIYRLSAQSEAAGNPLRMTDLNQEAALFGVRRLNASTMLNNPALVMSDSTKKEVVPIEASHDLDWVKSRRERLFLLNKSASVFERGSLRLKGNEKLRAGMRLRVKHSSALTVTYYVTAVSHEYLPGAGFFTTAQVERGNGFILSAGLDRAPDLARRDLGGIR